MKAETEILQELESAVFNEFRRDVKRKFEKQSQRSLFALNERRPSLTQRNAKSRTSFRKKIMKQRSQEISAGKDEIDFGKSNEMIDLGTSVTQDGSSTSRFLTTAPLDTSFTSPHEQMRDMRRREKSSIIKQKYPLVDSSDPAPRPTPKNQHSVSFSSQKSTTVQQDLDFDLEVTVNIESGKCVFHPNNDVKVEPAEPRCVFRGKIFLLLLLLNFDVIWVLTSTCSSSQLRFKEHKWGKRVVPKKKTTFVEVSSLSFLNFILRPIDIKIVHHEFVDMSIIDISFYFHVFYFQVLNSRFFSPPNDEIKTFF